jgi:hypothetical protein
MKIYICRVSHRQLFQQLKPCSFTILLYEMSTEMYMCQNQNWDAKRGEVLRLEDDMLQSGQRIRMIPIFFGCLCCFIDIFTPPATEVAEVQEYT